MGEWLPIETADKQGPILLGRRGWGIVIAEWNDRGWVEYLGGELYGTKPPFEPTHWMKIKGPE